MKALRTVKSTPDLERSSFVHAKNMATGMTSFIILTIIAGMIIAPALWAAQTQAPIVKKIRIKITGGTEDPEQWKKIAQSLIYLEEGKRFSDSRFSQSVTALKQSGMFAAIDIPDPDWSKPTVDLLFRLEPFPRIKNIRIDGGFPLLEKQIHNVMTIATGDAYIPETLPHQKANIEKLFSKEGYIHPQVSVSAEKDTEDGHYIVDVKIQKGPFYRLEAVNINGNKAFSDGRLRMRLDTWQASLLFGGPSRFIQKEMHEDIETLRRFYLKEGYAEVRLDSNLEKDPENGTLRVTINISEGPHYTVHFKGNNAFRRFTLEKDLVLFTQGNKSGFGIQKSIRNMEKRYRKAGYLDIRIIPEETMSLSRGQPQRLVSFAVDEGPRYIVKKVAFEGNQEFAEEKIKKQMITHPPGILADGQYVPEALKEDIRAVKALYLESGFRKTNIEYDTLMELSPGSPEVIEVFVTVSIEEGPKTLVANISINGPIPIPSDHALGTLSMRTGSPFRQYLLKADRNALAARISEKGYPHVTVEPETVFSGEGKSVDITYTVDSGPYVEMGQTFFIGNFKTRPSVLIREMELYPGDPLSLSKMLASQRNIRNVNAVKAASFKTFGIEEKAERATMLAEIQEVKPYFVEFAAGYDTHRLLYLNAAAGNSNLLGLNNEVRTGMEWSQIGYRAELGLREPRLLGTRISSSTNLYSEKIEELNKDFGIRTNGASVGFSRRMTDDLTTSLNFQFEYREQYHIDDSSVSEVQADEYDPRAILVTTPSLVYTTTDSFVRPTRGVRTSFSVDMSKGIQHSLDDFFKYRLDARYYFTPIEVLTLAVHGRIGYIDIFGGRSRIPEDQLFFLGGIADVRGFSENRLRFDAEKDPVGGRIALLGSAEARIDLGMNFELAVFYDTGSVRDPLTDAGSDEFRSSAGLGLRYNTPIGPIGCMYGWKLDRKPGESPGAFHFAIGYTF